MADDKETELWRVHRAAQEKHTYFLLAAAGACIGYALTQAKDLRLEWMHVALAGALLSWALSFLFGCRHIDRAQAVTSINIGLIKVQAGRDPRAGKDPNLIAYGQQVFGELLSTQQSKASRAFRWQYRLLISGVIFYVAWQVWLMHSRTFQ